MAIALLIGRIIFGGYFIYSGFGHFRNTKMLTGYAKSKSVPMPEAAVLVGGAMMLLGGLGVLFGVYMQWALALIAIFLLVVSFAMHAFWNDKDPTAKMGNQINFSKNIALLGAALMLMSL
jgi:uncharacterized membrane protein YphA (DoxX/SURF4 family)